MLCDVLDMSLYEFFGLSTPFVETPCGRDFLKKVSSLNAYNGMLIGRIIDSMIDAQEEERRKSITEKICRIFRNAEKTAAGYGNPLGDHRRGSYIYLYGNDMIYVSFSGILDATQLKNHVCSVVRCGVIDE